MFINSTHRLPVLSGILIRSPLPDIIIFASNSTTSPPPRPAPTLPTFYRRMCCRPTGARPSAPAPSWPRAPRSPGSSSTTAATSRSPTRPITQSPSPSPFRKALPYGGREPPIIPSPLPGSRLPLLFPPPHFQGFRLLSSPPPQACLFFTSFSMISATNRRRRQGGRLSPEGAVRRLCRHYLQSLSRWRDMGRGGTMSTLYP